jgi:hypothetical protein
METRDPPPISAFSRFGVTAENYRNIAHSGKASPLTGAVFDAAIDQRRVPPSGRCML